MQKKICRSQTVHEPAKNQSLLQIKSHHTFDLISYFKAKKLNNVKKWTPSILASHICRLMEIQKKRNSEIPMSKSNFLKIPSQYESSVTKINPEKKIRKKNFKQSNLLELMRQQCSNSQVSIVKSKQQGMQRQESNETLMSFTKSCQELLKEMNQNKNSEESMHINLAGQNNTSLFMIDDTPRQFNQISNFHLLNQSDSIQEHYEFTNDPQINQRLNYLNIRDENQGTFAYLNSPTRSRQGQISSTPTGYFNEDSAYSPRKNNIQKNQLLLSQQDQ